MQSGNEDKVYIESLKKAVLSENGEGLTDEELMELLLSYVPCSLGVTETVENIRKRFGSCRRAYMASKEELTAVDGVTDRAATVIVLVSALMKVDNTDDYIGRKNIDFAKMFSSCIRRRFEEELWAAALDGDGKLLAVKNFSAGSTVGVSLTISVLMHFVHINNAAALVLAHTHPDGTSTAVSYDDYESALRIHNALSRFGVRLLGQVIIVGWESEYHEFDPDGTRPG